MRAKSAVALTRYPAKAERAEEYSLPCVKWLMLYVRSVLSTVSTAAAVRKDRMVPRACKGLPGIRIAAGRRLAQHRCGTGCIKDIVAIGPSSEVAAGAMHA